MTQIQNYYNANDDKGRDYICSAEGASTMCESLRQKNSCLTQLWRVLTNIGQPPKGKASLGKLSGARTETFFLIKGGLCPFFADFLS